MTTQSTKPMQGGDGGATGWGEKVYGAVGGQSSVSSFDNTIKMTGGKRKRRGGNPLVDIVVPAGFVLANQLIKRKHKFSKSVRFSKRRGSRSRRTRRSRGG
jgi:hypothetical protein